MYALFAWVLTVCFLLLSCLLVLGYRLTKSLLVYHILRIISHVFSSMIIYSATASFIAR